MVEKIGVDLIMLYVKVTRVGVSVENLPQSYGTHFATGRRGLVEQREGGMYAPQGLADIGNDR
jgi:hypothetical protein